MLVVCSCPKDNCPMHNPNKDMGTTTTTDNEELTVIMAECPRCGRRDIMHEQYH